MNRIVLLINHFCVVLAMSVFFAGCHPNSCLLEPEICYFPQCRQIENLPCPFLSLSTNELQFDWAREMKIGRAFAREFDFYRAITSYKRALILISAEQHQRQLEIEYDIILCYYLARKYQDAVETFEASCLSKDVTTSFPGLSTLLIVLYDAYDQLDQEDKANAILIMIQKYSPESAKNLALLHFVQEGEFCNAENIIEGLPAEDAFHEFNSLYISEAKSVRKAQTLNAILPGAGYYYVGQKKSALTSFIINALFTAAAVQFFDHGYIAAGLVTTSLELGWYLGGINGAGLAAKEYNEQFYNTTSKDFLIQNRLFPVLMFEYAF